MSERPEIEAKVEKLQGLVGGIEVELGQARQALEDLDSKRMAAMVEALQEGKRADVTAQTEAIARQRETVENLEAEGMIAQNILDNQRAELEPFVARERLLADAEQWEKLCYEVKALHDKRGDDWQARKDYSIAAFERDELGLQILLDSRVGSEAEIRRHRDKGAYLGGPIDHYTPFSGLYPEVWVLLRQLQAELKGSDVKVPQILVVSGVTVAQALAKYSGDGVNRLCRYKPFAEFYQAEVVQEPPTTGDIYERGSGVIYR